MQPQYQQKASQSAQTLIQPFQSQLIKYTIIPIQNPQHREKLQNFISNRGKLKSKSSLCRFYLRGICIMKHQYCKFAHSVNQLHFNDFQSMFYTGLLSQKQKKKRQFVQKKQFNQTALFILKNVKYYVLYQYQFSDRYKSSGLPIHKIDTISTDRSTRIRIRQIMHRQNWDGFINFLQTKYPNTNYPISFISFWYANFGFDKPQTRCKFGDFLKYAMHVRKYIQVDIVFPPNLYPSIYLINSNSKNTVLENNVNTLYQLCMKQKQQYGKEQMQKFLQEALPNYLSKKYICRYYMAGCCQQAAEKCLYAHSIKQLSSNYQLQQEFPVNYRQPVLPIQLRMNYISLYQATRKYQSCKIYTLQQINFNSTVRNQLREKLHFQLFGDFIKFIQDISKKRKNSNLKINGEQKEEQQIIYKQQQIKQKQIMQQQYVPFQISLKQLQTYYQGAGFNHTNQNKFQHFQSSLWDLGYYMEDIVIKDEATLQKRKCAYIYKIPPVSYLNKAYKTIIEQCINNQLNSLQQNIVILQSNLKRIIYSYRKQKILPLHVYLRYRNISFQNILIQFCTAQQVQRIFFQSGQQNIKKINQIVRKFIKKNKNYIVSIDDIQNYIKKQKKQQINLNHFLNLRIVIQTAIIQNNRFVYFWPFDNNAFMIDSNHLQLFKKKVLEKQQKMKMKDQKLEEFKIKCIQEQIVQHFNERIIIVDSNQKLQYAIKYLSFCGQIGVDLEGKLRIDGYIDLIQVSGVKRDSQNNIIKKQIFIFDIFIMKKTNKKLEENLQNNQQNQQTVNQQKDSNLFQQTLKFLKDIFQNSKITKILHDCRQDSIALKYLLQINLVNVFDTSGFDVYLSQKSLYSDKTSNITNTLRKIYDVKVPGLNTILDYYKAPNGINIFKQSMKKKFGQAYNREYFEQRPIDEQFLEYSARDVEDLIQVYENMIQSDQDYLSHFIGKLYSQCDR